MDRSPHLTGWTKSMVGRATKIAAACTAAVLASGCGPEAVEPADVPELSLEALPPIQPGSRQGGQPFGRVADIEIGEDGSLFVLDALSRTIRVFDGSGAELRSFGGHGQGPGEFERPAHLFWGPKGDLWVVDLGTGRVSAFDPQGELTATKRPADLPIVFPFAIGFSGVDTLRVVGVTSPDPSSPSAAWVEALVVGEEIRPVTRADLAFVEWPTLFEYRTEDVALVLPIPFSGEPLFGFDPSGDLWYTHTGSDEVYRWSATGGVDLTLGRDLAPIPVSGADRDAVLAGPDFQEVRRTAGPAGVAEMSSMIPDARPKLAGFFFDDAGRVWVIRAPRDPRSPERAIDVYDRTGTPFATAHAVVSARPRPRVRAGLLAAVARDELGVESLVLYRVDR